MATTAGMAGSRQLSVAATNRPQMRKSSENAPEPMPLVKAIEAGWRAMRNAAAMPATGSMRRLTSRDARIADRLQASRAARLAGAQKRWGSRRKLAQKSMHDVPGASSVRRQYPAP